MLNQYEIGFRVPMIVVSPYSNLKNAGTGNNINHTFYEFGSILKFIENTFGLGKIAPSATLPYADDFTGPSTPGDLSDCFNFAQTPLTFKAVQAKQSASYFLNEKRAPTDPDDD